MAQLGVGRVMRLLSSLFLGRKTAAGGCVSGEDSLRNRASTVVERGGARLAPNALTLRAGCPAIISAE